MKINKQNPHHLPSPSGEGPGERLMAHLVLGYPTLSESLKTAERYIRSGIRILELQIPFSHPTADGPVITAACREAVERQRVSVAGCLAAIGTIRSKYPAQEIFVMSYLNRIFAYGIERFTATLEALKIKHLIVPDLPVDATWPANKINRSVRLVPVLAANVSDERLGRLLAMNFDFYYLMSGFKVTGSAFTLHPGLKEIIRKIKNSRPGRPPRIGIGFGVSTPEQAPGMPGSGYRHHRFGAHSGAGGRLADGIFKGFNPNAH